MRADNKGIGLPRPGMEQNHFRWITLLDVHADRNALGDSEPAELRQEIHPFTRTPIESDVKGNGKHKAQLGALHLRERESVSNAARLASEKSTAH